MPPKRKAGEVVTEATEATEALAARRVVGAHVSASGGCFKAVENASVQLGPLARSFAFFIRPRLTFRPVPPLPAPEVDKFHAALAQTPFPLDKVVVHGSYLINFGSHNASLRRRSVELMVEEVAKCEQLGVGLYVFHPGAATGEPSKKRAATKTTNRKKKRGRGDTEVHEEQEEEQVEDEEKDEEEDAQDRKRLASVEFVAQCVVEVLRRTDSTTLVLENACGHGNALASDFSELRALLDAIAIAAKVVTALGEKRLHVESRVGVCLDTCHAFASGYAMDSARACEQMMEAFEEAMGPTWLARNVLKVVHVNDSKDPVGSRRDCHANIGRGTIGLPAFQWLMTSERFTDVPMILETPRHEKTAKQAKKSNSKKKSRHSSEDDAQPDHAEETDVPSAQDEIALLMGLCGGEN